MVLLDEGGVYNVIYKQEKLEANISSATATTVIAVVVLIS